MKPNYFKKLDFLGEEPKSTYGKAPRFQTYLGALLSIMSVAIIAISIWKSFQDFIDPNSVEVSTSTVFEKEYPRIDLVKNGFYPMVSV